MFIFLAASIAACPGHADTPSVAYDTDRMQIETASGILPFSIEVARSPKQLAHGLMWRTQLADDYAMLFIFGNRALRHMWMKNTPSPLDMLFVDAHGTITSIHANATPFSLEVISSKKPVPAVIEMRGGLAAQKGIRPGDRVIHPYFTGTP